MNGPLLHHTLSFNSFVIYQPGQILLISIWLTISLLDNVIFHTIISLSFSLSSPLLLLALVVSGTACYLISRQKEGQNLTIAGLFSLLFSVQ